MAVVDLASGHRPRTVDEGLERLRSIGIYSGVLRQAESGHPSVAIEATGQWRASDSGLLLGADGVVAHFWSHLWFNSPSQDMALGIHTLVEAIGDVMGAPLDDLRRSDGSRSALWHRPAVDVEIYLHSERPNAGVAAQMGVTWTDLVG